VTWSNADQGLPLVLVHGFDLSPAAQIVVDSDVTPSVLYFCFFNGAEAPQTWRSSDGGGTWRLAAPAGFPVASGNGVVYAGGSVSSDHGISWQTVSLPPELPSALVLAPGSTATVFAATPGQGVWMSGDGAESWQPATAGIFATSPQAFVIDPQEPKVMFAVVDDEGILPYGGGRLLKTSNAGAAWQQIGPDWLMALLPSAASSGALTIDPANSSILYVGTRSGIARSDDGGLSWARVGQPSGDRCFGVTAIAIARSTAETVYAAGSFGPGCHCGLVKSTDSGQSWQCVDGHLDSAGGVWAPRLHLRRSTRSLTSPSVPAADTLPVSTAAAMAARPGCTARSPSQLVSALVSALSPSIPPMPTISSQRVGVASTAQGMAARPGNKPTVGFRWVFTTTAPW
jgi:hypothetical protein